MYIWNENVTVFSCCSEIFVCFVLNTRTVALINTFLHWVRVHKLHVGSRALWFPKNINILSRLIRLRLSLLLDIRTYLTAFCWFVVCARARLLFCVAQLCTLHHFKLLLLLHLLLCCCSSSFFFVFNFSRLLVWCVSEKCFLFDRNMACESIFVNISLKLNFWRETYSLPFAVFIRCAV